MSFANLILQFIIEASKVLISAYIEGNIIPVFSISSIPN